MTTSPNLDRITKDAQAAYQAKNFIMAAELYQKAAAFYEQAGDRLAAAEMANNRSVTLLIGGDARAALVAAEGSDRLFAEAGDTKRQAIALGNLAAALEALGELDKAITTYQNCADLLEQVGEKELRACVLKTLSALNLRTGKLLESIAAMRAAMESEPKQSLIEKFIKKLLRVTFQMIR